MATHGPAGNMACKCNPNKQFATTTTLMNHFYKNGMTWDEIFPSEEEVKA